MSTTFPNAAYTHLSTDPIMKGLIDTLPRPEWKQNPDLFFDIIDAIISQQLSGKASATILKRFTDLVGEQSFNAEHILTVGESDMRACGISFGKIKYIKGFCEAVIKKELVLADLTTLNDQEFTTKLTALKGIGPWTAEMMLMFSLQRPDIFSIGDLGLRTAIGKLYAIDRDDLKKIEKISLKWKPYRSLASRYLWKSLEKSI